MAGDPSRAEVFVTVEDEADACQSGVGGGEMSKSCPFDSKSSTTDFFHFGSCNGFQIHLNHGGD